MSKRVLLVASNYGLWAEELQAPWDALREAGHRLTLATRTGRTPIPLKVSMDAEMIDPVQKYRVNPESVVRRCRQILDEGEWDHPIKIDAARMADFDAFVMVGGPGAALDITGNAAVHRLALETYRAKKLLGAICYAVGALVFTRDPGNRNRSVLWGHTVTAHPHAWDFEFDMGYELVQTALENRGTDLVTPGFVFPLQYIVEDAVGPEGKVLAHASASREKPCVATDGRLVSALSVESSIAFGAALVRALAA